MRAGGTLRLAFVERSKVPGMATGRVTPLLPMTEIKTRDVVPAPGMSDVKTVILGRGSEDGSRKVQGNQEWTREAR